MNQPIGELRDGARRRQRQPRLDVHMPPVDYGAITAAAAITLRQDEQQQQVPPYQQPDDKVKAYNFKKVLQSDLQSAIVLSRAKTYKDMYDIAVENEADIKCKAGEESNKKMRFLASQGQVKQHSTTFRPGQQFKSTGSSRFMKKRKVP
ncbi:hypothetical protein ACH5RR_026702 [Cinchona calisaya]|uniref:Uncharacterized protein n=1 Tax=Cinchona calisaya TaxID=153742 RepID=A0ABD2Z6M2_9GENT